MDTSRQLHIKVAKEEREELIEMVSDIYRKHDFEFMHVSKRIENVPPVGWDRGRSSIHILRSLFGVDWEEMVQVGPIYEYQNIRATLGGSFQIFFVSQIHCVSVELYNGFSYLEKIFNQVFFCR